GPEPADDLTAKIAQGSPDPVASKAGETDALGAIERLGGFHQGQKSRGLKFVDSVWEAVLHASGQRASQRQISRCQPLLVLVERRPGAIGIASLGVSTVAALGS